MCATSSTSTKSVGQARHSNQEEKIKHSKVSLEEEEPEAQKKTDTKSKLKELVSLNLILFHLKKSYIENVYMTKLIWKNCLVKFQKEYLIKAFGDIIAEDSLFFAEDSAKIFKLIENNFQKYESIDLFNSENRKIIEEELETFKKNLESKLVSGRTQLATEFDPLEMFDCNEDRDFLRYQKRLFEDSDDEHRGKQKSRLDHNLEVRKLSSDSHETIQKIMELELLNSKIAYQIDKFRLVLSSAGSIGYQFFLQIFKLKYIEMYKSNFQSEKLRDYRQSIHFFINETLAKSSDKEIKQLFDQLREKRQGSPKKETEWDEFSSLSFVDNHSYIHTPKSPIRSARKGQRIPPFNIEPTKKSLELSGDPNVQEILKQKSLLTDKKRSAQLKQVLEKARQGLENSLEIEPEKGDLLFVQDLNFLSDLSEVQCFTEQLFLNPDLPPRKFGSGIHILFLVHGLDGSFEDMNIFRLNLAFIRHELLVVNIMNVEEKTNLSLETLGRVFASEVTNWLDKRISSCVSKISFLGFSLGGLIIRSGLRFLSKFRRYFCSFLTFGSPHLGMCYNNSVLISLGMRFFINFKKYESIRQLLFKDKDELQKNFLYILSKDQVGPPILNNEVPLLL